MAIGEFAWHVSGSNSLEFIAYYTDRWREFSDDGSTIKGSCYGHRIFGSTPSRWSQLIKLLTTDPDTRRAVLSFADMDSTFTIDARDVPCATTLQFLLRSDGLHAFVTMRSNDVIWGLPYDIFLFTMLQELLANALNVPLGTYHHFAGSFHLYKRHREFAQEILSVPDTASSPMAPMEASEQLPAFLRCEALLRSGTPLVNINEAPFLAPYWRNLLDPLELLRRDKHR